jgi:hypothetical protein
MSLDEPFIFDDMDNELYFGCMNIRGEKHPIPIDDFDEYMDSLVDLPTPPPKLIHRLDVEMDDEFRAWLFSPPCFLPNNTRTPSHRRSPLLPQSQKKKLDRAHRSDDHNMQNNRSRNRHGTKEPDYHRHALFRAMHERMVMGKENDIHGLDWRLMLYVKGYTAVMYDL